MEMHDTYFVMDESGDRGFIDDEPSLDSFGLIAGFAFPAHNKSLFENKLIELYNKLDTKDMKKIRSACAFVGDRNIKVKNEYIRFFCDSELLIVYQAMFLRGSFIVKQLAKELKQLAKESRCNKHIKILSEKKKQDVYFEILSGLLIKLDEICKVEESSNMAILTDTVDKKILSDARHLLNHLKRDKHSYKLKAVNTQKRENVEKQLISKIYYPISIKNIDMINISDRLEITFAGDFIANSIYRHLKKKIQEGCDHGLNSQKIIQDFPLFSKIALLNDDNITDKLFSNHNSGE